jgi:hypothetical protein
MPRAAREPVEPARRSEPPGWIGDRHMAGGLGRSGRRSVGTTRSSPLSHRTPPPWRLKPDHRVCGHAPKRTGPMPHGTVASPPEAPARHDRDWRPEHRAGCRLQPDSGSPCGDGARVCEMRATPTEWRPWMCQSVTCWPEPAGPAMTRPPRWVAARPDIACSSGQSLVSDRASSFRCSARYCRVCRYRRRGVDQDHRDPAIPACGRSRWRPGRDRPASRARTHGRLL